MMNKRRLPHIITVGSFVVFVVLGLASVTLPSPAPSGQSSPAPSEQPSPAPSEQPNFSRDWALGNFTDQWGTKTGKYFMVFQGRIRGVFSNRVASNASLTVEELTFSNEYLSFDLLEYGGNTLLGSGMTSTVTVTMVTRSLGEKTFSGGIASSSTKTVIVNFNEDLLEVFKLQEEVNFRITVANRAIGENYYQFSFTPRNFVAAYDAMNALGAQ